MLVVCRIETEGEKLCLAVSEGHDDGWYLDTGATAHITHDRSDYAQYNKVSEGQKIVLGNGLSLDIEGTGDVMIMTASTRSLTLRGVLHVPGMQKKLVSVRQLLQEDPALHMRFHVNRCSLHSNGIVIAEGHQSNELYRLTTVEACMISTRRDETEIWHAHLAHPSYAKLGRIANAKVYADVQLVQPRKGHFCKAYQLGKQSKEPYPSGAGMRASG